MCKTNTQYNLNCPLTRNCSNYGKLNLIYHFMRPVELHNIANLKSSSKTVQRLSVSSLFFGACCL